MNISDKVLITALRADGKAYRWWNADIKQITSDCIVTRMSMGERVYEPNTEWLTMVHTQTFYWNNKPYNLTESYSSAGEPMDLYMNISSPIIVKQSELLYYDYELDVLKQGDHISILDEDEFKIAIREYKYNDDFIKECYKNVKEAVEVLRNWLWMGI